MPVMMGGASAWPRGPDPVADPRKGLAGGGEQGMLLGHGPGAGRSEHQHAGDLAEGMAQIFEVRTCFEHVADRPVVERPGVERVTRRAGKPVMIFAAAAAFQFGGGAFQMFGLHAVIDPHRPLPAPAVNPDTW